MLVAVSGSSILMPAVRADYHGDFNSVQDNGASSNLGMIHFADTTVPLSGDYSLPQIHLGVGIVDGPYTATITYIPAPGYSFLRWETSGNAFVADPSSRTTVLTPTGQDYTVTAIYTIGRPVGGVVLPTNKLEMVTPFAALAGLIVAVSAVVVVKRKTKA